MWGCDSESFLSGSLWIYESANVAFIYAWIYIYIYIYIYICVCVCVCVCVFV